MIKKIKKERKAILGWGIGILAVFFLLRLINLTLLPVFADEAIYIRWAQVMKAEPSLRFLPLSDGKQPLFMWILMGFLAIIKDPLFAGRLLSVLAGLGSLIGIFFLTNELFKNKKTALIASFFYAVVPFFVFFDRMALVDSLLAMLGIWVFYFGLLLMRTQRFALAIVTGVTLGLALITKSPAIFFALLLPSVLIFHPFPFPSSKKFKRWRHLAKAASLWLIVYAIAFLIYNFLRLSRNFHMIALRNKDYVFSLDYLMSHPFDPLKPHLFDLAHWLPNLLTWPILLFAVLGFFWLWLKKENWRQATWLLLVFLVPLLVQSIFAKVFTPRYLLFTIWPILIMAAFFSTMFAEKLAISIRKEVRPLQVLLVFLVVIPSFYYNYLLLTQPEQTPLPRRMRSGYLEEWTAGQGLKEIADFIKKEAKDKNVLVGTEGFFGTLPDGLQIYVEKVPRITIIGVGYPINKVEQGLVNALIDNDVYLVVNQSRFQLNPELGGLELVEEYPKAIPPQRKQDKLLFFKLDKDFWQQ